ncbi:anaphase-promoting complex subunit Hcn1 [Phlyctochytrium planicorne]|nr:anaphase-promoting complex subunit Hcn1 [Phlyctochytrium planicorne]
MDSTKSLRNLSQSYSLNPNASNFNNNVSSNNNLRSTNNAGGGGGGGGVFNVAEENRIAALAIDLRDKLMEMELQLKLLSPIANEILNSLESYNSQGKNDAPISSNDQMLVGLRWDFESDAKPVTAGPLSSSMDFGTSNDYVDRSNASNLWRRMMKKVPKNMTVQGLNTCLETATPHRSFQDGSGVESDLEFGSMEALDASHRGDDGQGLHVLRTQTSIAHDVMASTSLERSGGFLNAGSRSGNMARRHTGGLRLESRLSNMSEVITNDGDVEAAGSSAESSSSVVRVNTKGTVGTAGTGGGNNGHVTSPLSPASGGSAESSSELIVPVSRKGTPTSPIKSHNRRPSSSNFANVHNGAGGEKQAIPSVPPLPAAGTTKLPEKEVVRTKTKDTLKEILPVMDLFKKRHALFIIAWEFCIAIYFLGLIWVIPLILAFNLDFVQVVVTILTSVVFSFDTFFEILTVREDLSTSTSLRKWMLKYLSRNIIIDIITIVPFDLIPFQGSDYFLFLRYLRVFRLPETFKRSPIYSRMRMYLEKKMGIGETYFGFIVLFSVIIMALHIQACAYWIAERNYNGLAYKTMQGRAPWDQYVWGFFQGVGNTFPLIYQPENFIERWIVIFFAFINAVLYAVVVGSFSSYVVGLNASARLYRQKIDELNDYMHWKRIPKATKDKVLVYYEIKYRGKFFEESTLLGEMNESLRTEIAVHNCRELIEKVPFLRRQQNDGRDEQFLGRIARSLSVGYYVNDDFIIRQGEIGTEMYFIVTGKVNIIVNGNQVASFTDEVALIANIPRTASVIAATPSIIYKLTRTEFMDILLEFDDMRVRIDRIYQERMAKVRAERAMAEMVKSS